MRQRWTISGLSGQSLRLTRRDSTSVTMRERVCLLALMEVTGIGGTDGETHRSITGDPKQHTRRKDREHLDDSGDSSVVQLPRCCTVVKDVSV